MDEKKKDKIRNLMVVKATDFIQKVTYDLTANEQKLIAYCISSITPSDKNLHKLNIKVADFCDVCGIDKNHFYTDFKDLISNLDKKVYWLETEDKLFNFRWFSEVVYKKDSGTVQLQMNSSLAEYLVNLQLKYTKYELYNILALRSRYSIRLYEIFKSYKYANKKKAIVELDLDALRKQIGAEHKTFDNFAALRRRVIDVAKKEINEYTDIDISYEIGKRERKKVKSVVFTITEKSVANSAFSLHRTLSKLEN